jgi:hypothetical protein
MAGKHGDDREHDDSGRGDKKEKVLHARIPEALDAELKDRAADLGVSVSNLVRNVLQNTFGMVGDIVADSARIARQARGGKSGHARRRDEAAPAPIILGWQELILGRNALCDRCNAILAKGAAAAVSVPETASPGEPHLVRCLACVKETTNDRGSAD